MGHTPGRWVVDDVWIMAIDSDGVATTVAEMHLDFNPYANAHLIAASPDLLLALRRLLAMWEGEFGPSQGRPDPGGALRAIAKAEGRGE